MTTTFGEKVRRRLKERGLDQKDLADALDTKQPQVSRWITGDGTPPKAETLLRIARYLGLTVDYLIDPAQTEADPDSGVSEDEAMILEVYRALRLSKREAIRRLAIEGPAKELPEFYPPDAAKGRLVQQQP